MSASDDNPGVIAPPPLLFAITLGAGLALDLLLPGVQMGVSEAWRYGLAVLFAVVAVALIASAFVRFRWAGYADNNTLDRRLDIPRPVRLEDLSNIFLRLPYRRRLAQCRASNRICLAC